MAGTLFFVHGTGVREDGYKSTWAEIQDGAHRNAVPAGAFVGCLWGPSLGTRSGLLSETLPVQPLTRAALDEAAVDGDSLEAAYWAALIEDPLFELRLLAMTAERLASDVVVGEWSAGQEAVEMVHDLTAESLSLATFELTAAELQAAADELAASAELASAAAAVGSAMDPDFVDSVSRALVALILVPHMTDSPGTSPLVALDASARDDLVARVALALSPDSVRQTAIDSAKQRSLQFVVGRVAVSATKRRQRLMNWLMPMVGDILLYQRRGQPILDMVANRMVDLERPIVAVGHSLGGIILVDLLTRDQSCPIDLLVTVGSQSPLFYAIDVLGWLRPGQEAPRAPTPWLNIYSDQDLLSFCAARIFPGVSGIYDEPVSFRIPFPTCHSAYWRSDRIYELLKAHWPASIK